MGWRRPGGRTACREFPARQFRRAHQDFQRTVQAAVSVNFPEVAAQWTMEDAEGHAIAHAVAAELGAGWEVRQDLTGWRGKGKP